MFSRPVISTSMNPAPGPAAGWATMVWMEM